MDPSIYRFIYITLGILSIIMPGNEFRFVSFMVALILLALKVRDYRENPNENGMEIFDIIGIVIIIILDIVLVVMGMMVQNKIEENFPTTSTTTSSYSEKNILKQLDDSAELTIKTFKAQNPELFSEGKNNTKKIKSGFKTFLKEKLQSEGIDITSDGNDIKCDLGQCAIIYTVHPNDITYKLEFKNITLNKQ